MDKKINKNKIFFIGEHVFCLKDFGNLKNISLALEHAGMYR